MKENKIEVLRKRIIAFQKRDKKLAQKDVLIEKLMDEHNTRFAAIRKKYVFLSWSDKKIRGLLRDFTHESFLVEMNSLDKLYGKQTNGLGAKDKSEKGIEYTMDYNSDVLVETQYRWNQICVDRAKLLAGRISVKQEELKLANAYNDLIWTKKAANQAAWQKLVDAYPEQHHKLIESLEKLMSKDEELQKELESILTFREKIYKIEQELKV